MPKKKVMVGMSGGVDSSVTAILLQEQGYDVIGVTFRLKPDCDERDSCSDDIKDARAVCQRLGISHQVVDYRQLFEEKVIQPFVQSYRQGRTPNPCVNCNRFIKFGDFYRLAAEQGVDYIATGHYANIVYEEESGRWRLMRGEVSEKDQSYVLYNLTQQQLAATLMPLGRYGKGEVRQIAEDRGFLSASKRSDSQDICFIPDGDYASFLKKYTGETSDTGHFVDTEGNILGEHKGIEHYTIGQRRGLGMSFGKPMFVKTICPANRTVVLADSEELFSVRLVAGQVQWMDEKELTEPLSVLARIRYAHTPAPAAVYPLPNGRVEVLFDQPQRAITPGQAVAFYQGDFLLGGGTIEE